MRRLAGQLTIAAVFLVVGLVCWKAGQIQSRVADAHEQMALLHYDALEAAYDDIEQSVGLVGRLPWLTDRLAADAREQRAAARYWQARYEALEPQRNAAGAVAEPEPSLLAVSANAAFRTSQDRGDRQTALRQLDAALKSYTELLKKSPGNAEAAYNYELVVRLRDRMAKMPPTASRPDDAARARQASGMAGDLPEGRTIHGDPGSPPPKTDMSQFKMHIPVRPDERQGGSDAGQGRQKIRKG